MIYLPPTPSPPPPPPPPPHQKRNILFKDMYDEVLLKYADENAKLIVVMNTTQWMHLPANAIMWCRGV